MVEIFRLIYTISNLFNFIITIEFIVIVLNLFIFEFSKTKKNFFSHQPTNAQRQRTKKCKTMMNLSPGLLQMMQQSKNLINC